MLRKSYRVGQAFGIKRIGFEPSFYKVTVMPTIELTHGSGNQRLQKTCFKVLLNVVSQSVENAVQRWRGCTKQGT